jgi:glycosyltransferase involved in cell wall biosynthesis
VASSLATLRHHFTDDAIRFVSGGDPDALARAVEALVDDPDGTVRMGREAQRQAMAYDWEAQKDRYLAIVDDLSGLHEGDERDLT